VYVSYRLNGLELEKSLRNLMKGDWCMICGDWSPLTTQGAVLQYDSTDLTNGMKALLKRIETKYTKLADWRQINHCVQKEGEDVDLYFHRLKEAFDIHSGINPPGDGNTDSPYEQQLKNAFLNGCLPQISSFVTKHMVDHRTARLENLKDWAIHAEEHFNNKKKNKKGLNFLLEGSEATMYVMRDENTEKYRGRGRRRHRGRDTCGLCGRRGHWARDCRSKRKIEEEFGSQL